MPKCAKCKRELPEDCFTPGRGAKQFSEWCKECTKQRQKELYPEIPEGYKRCSYCKQILPESSFGPSKNAYDGLQTSCKECKKIRYQKSEKYEVQSEGTRICSFCGKEQPLVNFGISRMNSEGRQMMCRSCKAAYDAKRQFPVQQTGTKFCPVCKKILPVSKFGIDRGNPTGRFYSCRGCAVAFQHQPVKKVCRNCGKEFITKRGTAWQTFYCSKCMSHSVPELRFMEVLKRYNIEFDMEFSIDSKYWYDFILPEYKMLIDVNPIESHSAVDYQIFRGKSINYHIERRKLAEQNGFTSICLWSWDFAHFDEIVKAIYLKTLKINKHQGVTLYWCMPKSNWHQIDDGTQNEEEMLRDGFLPVYDDGQEVIY